MADVIRNRVQRERSVLRSEGLSCSAPDTATGGSACCFAFSASRAFITGAAVANHGSKCGDTLGLPSHSLNHRITKLTQSQLDSIHLRRKTSVEVTPQLFS